MDSARVPKVRIPIELAETLVERIDDWRFEQRMPSRSEAMRKLIEIGMEKTASPQAGR